MQVIDNITEKYVFFRMSENKSEDRVNLELPKDFYTIHFSIKSSLATPRRYMSFIDTYINLYSDKTKIIFQRQTKLKVLTRFFVKYTTF